MRFAFILLLLACSDSPEAPVETVEPTERGTGTGGVTNPETIFEPHPNGEPCELVRERVAALIATPAGSCTADEQCACYPAFVDCGGVAHQDKVQEINRLIAQAPMGGCGYEDVEGNAFNCAPWECVPVCGEGGFCQRASP